eukprot:3331579-Alexandrium_andersonii.AAC.1
MHAFEKDLVFLEPPEEAEVPDGYVWRLLRALYGRRSAPRDWQQHLSNILASLGFLPVKGDHSLFYNKTTDTYLLVHVDDLAVTGPTAELEIAEGKVFHELQKQLLIKIDDMETEGSVAKFLGATKYRVERGLLTVPKESLITDILALLDMQGATS